MPRKYDDEDDDLRPRRSTRPREDEDEDRLDEVRPRKKKRPARKSSGLGALWLALGIMAGLAALGGIGAALFFLLRPVLESPGQKRAHVIDEATALLARVNDNTSAHAAQAPLVAVGQRLSAYEKEDMEKLKQGLKYLNDNPEAIKEAMDKAMANPQKAQAEADKMAAQELPMKQATERLVREMQRVWAYPSGQDAIKAFLQAWGKPPVMFGLFDGPNPLAGLPQGPGFGGPGFGGPAGALPGAAPQNPPPFQPRPPQGQPAQPRVPSKCNPGTWAQVQPGMTEADVVNLLGPPRLTHDLNQGLRGLHYHGDGVSGVVMLQNGKVLRKTGG